jgi:hypothetical protein
MSSFIAFIFILIFVVAFAMTFGSAGVRFKKKGLLTVNEQEFYLRLRQALPDHIVLTQVSMGAVLDVADNKSKNRYADRNRFSQKIIDFVVCEPSSMNIVAIVELDDRSHSAKSDADRDKMLQSVGYRTIRWNSKNKPSEMQIKNEVLEIR